MFGPVLPPNPPFAAWQRGWHGAGAERDSGARSRGCCAQELPPAAAALPGWGAQSRGRLRCPSAALTAARHRPRSDGAALTAAAALGCPFFRCHKHMRTSQRRCRPWQHAASFHPALKMDGWHRPTWRRQLRASRTEDRLPVQSWTNDRLPCQSWTNDRLPFQNTIEDRLLFPNWTEDRGFPSRTG